MCRLWRWIFWFYWSIYIQGSLFCWFYVLITNACFYVHLYIGMFLSFVKQQLRTVKFLDLRALRSFFMQVQYKRKILFHCYILVKSGQTPYNRSVTEKDILTSLPISCNCLPCWVCAFCKDLYIKLMNCCTIVMHANKICWNIPKLACFIIKMGCEVFLKQDLIKVLW